MIPNCVVVVAKLDRLKVFTADRLCTWNSCAQPAQTKTKHSALDLGLLWRQPYWKQLQRILPDWAREGNSQGPGLTGMARPAVAEVLPYYSTGMGNQRSGRWRTIRLVSATSPRGSRTQKASEKVVRSSSESGLARLRPEHAIGQFGDAHKGGVVGGQFETEGFSGVTDARWT